MRLIDRDEMLSPKIWDMNIPNDVPKVVHDSLFELYNRLIHIPTVDAELIRHGQWIRTEAYPHRVVCSECHKTYVRNENIIEGRYKGDEIVPIYCTEAEYCPHCGAWMDEVENNGEMDKT